MGAKVVIVVQARMSSSRLPGKVMMSISGKSLLARMIERLLMMNNEATLVIATTQQPEDDVIAAEAALLDIPLYRGSLDNLLDRHYQAAKIHEADIVLKIPSDCPLIDPRIIDHMITFFLHHTTDYLSDLHPASWPDTWDTGKDYSMSHRFTIDYQEDYLFIKRVFEELYPVKNNFSCDDILEFLQRKPEIYELNAKYAGVNWYRNHLNELTTIQPEQTNLNFKN